MAQRSSRISCPQCGKYLKTQGGLAWHSKNSCPRTTSRTSSAHRIVWGTMTKSPRTGLRSSDGQTEDGLWTPLYETAKGKWEVDFMAADSGFDVTSRGKSLSRKFTSLQAAKAYAQKVANWAGSSGEAPFRG